MSSVLLDISLGDAESRSSDVVSRLGVSVSPKKKTGNKVGEGVHDGF